MRTLRACVRAALGERDAVPGLVVCVQDWQGIIACADPCPQFLRRDGASRLFGSSEATAPAVFP